MRAPIFRSGGADKNGFNLGARNNINKCLAKEDGCVLAHLHQVRQQGVNNQVRTIGS